MKILRLLPLLLILLIQMSCKKKDSGAEDGSFDIKQFLIAGKSNIMGAQLPYIIVLNENDKAVYVNATGELQYTYKYTNGTLKLEKDGVNFITFKIINGAINSVVTDGDFASYSLVKVPATNQFAGNVFGGSWKTVGNPVSLLMMVKFNDTQYAEATLNVPVPSINYTTIKNISFRTDDPNTNNLTFWVLIDGKLESGRYNTVSKKYSYGSFSRS